VLSEEGDHIVGDEVRSLSHSTGRIQLNIWKSGNFTAIAALARYGLLVLWKLVRGLHALGLVAGDGGDGGDGADEEDDQDVDDDMNESVAGGSGDDDQLDYSELGDCTATEQASIQAATDVMRKLALRTRESRLDATNPSTYCNQVVEGLHPLVFQSSKDYDNDIHPGLLSILNRAAANKVAVHLAICVYQPKFANEFRRQIVHVPGEEELSISMFANRPPDYGRNAAAFNPATTFLSFGLAPCVDITPLRTPQDPPPLERISDELKQMLINPPEHSQAKLNTAMRAFVAGLGNNCAEYFDHQVDTLTECRKILCQREEITTEYQNMRKYGSEFLQKVIRDLTNVGARRKVARAHVHLAGSFWLRNAT
jgi:hypothetical protein